MPAGALRNRVSFYRRIVEDDGAGNKRGNFTSMDLHRWAQVKPMGGDEAVISAKLQSRLTAEVWVRSDAGTRGLTAQDRLTDDKGRSWNILTIENPDQRDKMLKLTVEAGAGDG